MKAKSIVSAALSLAGLIGLGMSIYFCAKETPEANEAFEEEKVKKEEARAEKDESAEDDPEESDPDLDIVDEIKIKVPHYKKTLIAAGITIFCIASGQIISLIAVSSAVGGMYAWQRKYHNLDSVVREATNSDIYKKVHTAYAKEVLKKGEATETKTRSIDKAFHKSKYFKVYEPETDQIIETTNEKISEANNFLHRRYVDGDFVSVPTIVKILGGKLAKKDEGLMDYGWSVDIDEQSEYAYEVGEKIPCIDIDVASTGVEEIERRVERMLCVFYSIPPKRYPFQMRECNT